VHALLARQKPVMKVAGFFIGGRFAHIAIAAFV
jgi:hypothetical protein